MTVTPNIAGRYREGHAIDCVICAGATAQHPEHAYLPGYVTHGLASNGHDRYWAMSPGFVGPFRSTRERAQADLDKLAAPGPWTPRHEAGNLYVGRVNPRVLAGIEYQSTAAGRNVRYGTEARARETASALNRSERENVQ